MQNIETISSQKDKMVQGDNINSPNYLNLLQHACKLPPIFKFTAWSIPAIFQRHNDRINILVISDEELRNKDKC